MGSLDTMYTYTYEGMDLNINFDIPSTPSQMDSMFDPMYASFEQELKPMPSSTEMNMNIQQQVEPGADYIFDRVPVKHEILTTEECLVDCWQVSDASLVDFIFDTPNETLYVTQTQGVETLYVTTQAQGVVVGDHFQLNGVASEVKATTSYFVNVMETTQSQTLPSYTSAPNFGNLSVGTLNPRCQLSQSEIEKRQKRKIKNRESAARSRARRLAFNAQQKLEIERLKKENGTLKKTLTALERMNMEQEVQMPGNPRTFSETLPPVEKL